MKSLPHLAMFALVGYVAEPQLRPVVALVWTAFVYGLHWAHGG